MNIFENIRLAITSLKAGKMRAFLTMLGIIIGISSVIAIFTVGNSLSTSISSSMAQLGANQIYAYLVSRESNVWREPEGDDLITNEMIEAFEARYADKLKVVETAEPAGSGQAKDGRRYANVDIIGLSAGATEAEGMTIVRGHDITKAEELAGRNVAVVSDKFVEKMFAANINPLGQEVQIRTSNNGVLTFTVVGVYKFEITGFMANMVNEEDLATNLIIPVTTAKRIMGSDPGHSQITVHFQTGVDSGQMVKDIEEFFGRYYERNDRFMVYTQNMENMLGEMMTMLDTVSVAISIIAAISLLVGGIGVMNIMLVSVTERTREIGTRKALGARNSAIRIQFIIESMIICLIGGIIGIGLGLLLGFAGSSLMGFPANPSMGIIVIAVTFSMAIGVFFGFYPANKAAKLDPIEALRYE